MIFIFKKQLFLLVLLANLTGSLAAIALEQLTEQAVCDAKISLEKQAQRDRILRYAVIGAAVGVTGFTMFKVMPTVSDYFKFKDDQARVAKDTKRFSALSAEHQDLIYSQLKEQLENEIKKDSKKSDSWLKTLWNGIPSAIGMVVLPEAVKAVYQRTSYLFNHKSILRLSQQLEIARCFGHLEKTLAQFAPKELVQNINYKNKKELLYDAQQLIIALDKMSSEEQEAYHKALHDIIIIDCNQLIKKMGSVIAYMRYSEEIDANHKIIINNFASQLFTATCEFHLQMQSSLDTQDAPGLLNATVLFQAAFNSAVTNFMTFTR